VDIAWSSLGDGPALVHLPGVPFSNVAAEWRSPSVAAAYSALAERVRLVQYDGRGTGHSQRDVTDFSLEANLRDLDAVLAASGLDREPVTLLGFYHSVTAAIAFAAGHPARVRSLVLFGGAARGWVPMSGAETQALLTLIERDWNAFVESIAHAWLGWDVSPDEGRLAAEWFRTASSPAVTRATLEQAASIDVTASLPLVRCPVTVLHRRDAAVVPLAASEELVAGIPGARLVVLPGHSASLFFEGADAIVDLLADAAGGRPRPTVRPVPDSQRDGSEGRAASRLSPLSPRELEVLRLLASGESNAEIAGRLGLTVNTVERHVLNLYRKIDARGRADAAAYAVRHGLA
jgi:DNA-binding CsgD family transcriptional regulator/pimeloyl-ACP methyl ester carboxylesterase